MASPHSPMSGVEVVTVSTPCAHACSQYHLIPRQEIDEDLDDLSSENPSESAATATETRDTSYAETEVTEFTMTNSSNDQTMPENEPDNESLPYGYTAANWSDAFVNYGFRLLNHELTPAESKAMLFQLLHLWRARMAQLRRQGHGPTRRAMREFVEQRRESVRLTTQTVVCQAAEQEQVEGMQEPRRQGDAEEGEDKDDDEDDEKDEGDDTSNEKCDGEHTDDSSDEDDN